MQRDQVIEELQKRYQEKKIIPFIGAGLSIPFGLPSWPSLIDELKKMVPPDVQPAIDSDLEIGEYQVAIDDIKKFARCDEQTIQERVADKYDIPFVEDGNRPDNNYIDLLKEDFSIYLTTNYDRLLEWYLPGAGTFSSLQEYTSNTQRLFGDSKKNIFHIHGTISNPSSIVISSKSYNTLYENPKYDDMMKAFSSSYSYLFIGFSFNDLFIKKLLTEHRGIYKGNHYLLMAKNGIQKSDLIRLKEQFGIKVLEYDPTNSSHLAEIRDIINDITQSPSPRPRQTNMTIQRGVGFGDIAKVEEHKNSLFYRKLTLAKVNPKIMELSTFFYIAAEKFIRESQKLGFPQEYIDDILVEVFLHYQEKYTLLYDLENKSSDDLVLAIHDDLKSINIDRYKQTTKLNPMTSETQGLIHVLADDFDKNVWWGRERFDESSK